MKISVLEVVIRLEGCYSLKEKRKRLSGLRDRFGKQVSLAVCESGMQDDLRYGQWAFVAAASSGKVVDKILNDVEEHIEDVIDGMVMESKRQIL